MSDQPRFTFAWNSVHRGRIVDTRHGTDTEALDYMRLMHGHGARLSAPGAPSAEAPRRRRNRKPHGIGS